MMKPSYFLPRVFLISLFSTASIVAAADYKASIGQDSNWNAVGWQPSGGPGATDSITDINASKTVNIYLNGDRSIAFLGKTTYNNVRFYDGALNGATPTPATSAFAIGEISITQGGYLFRSQSGGQLNVNVGLLSLGDPNIIDVQNPQIATFSVGVADVAENSNVVFTAARTNIYGRSNLVIAVAPVYKPLVDLGHVSFENKSTYTSQIVIGETNSPGSLDARVKVASLDSVIQTGTSTNLLRGGGVFEIYGDSGREEGSLVADFSGLIQDNLRLEKTGANIQILSRSGGNTFSGGTLITNGVLSVRNTTNSGLGKGAVEITGTGTLAGNGMVEGNAGNGIKVRQGGKIAPSADGSLTPQVLRLSGRLQETSTVLEMKKGSGFEFKIFAEGNDAVSFLNYKVGQFLLDGTEGGIAVDLLGDVKEGVFTLFTFRQAGEGSTLVASGLTDGLRLGIGGDGFEAYFHYDEQGFGGVGVIALELRAVPEPSSVVFLGCSSALAVLWAGRRSKGIRL